MTKPHLDDKDLHLIRSLRRNARASLVSLARDINLSRSATHDRILKLEESGIIQGYTIVVDRAVLPPVRAFFSIHFTNDMAQTKLTKVIHQIEGVEAAYCLSGDIDMLAYCECQSDSELGAIRDQLAGLAGVVSVRTRPVLATSQS